MSRVQLINFLFHVAAVFQFFRCLRFHLENLVIKLHDLNPAIEDCPMDPVVGVHWIFPVRRLADLRPDKHILFTEGGSSSFWGADSWKDPKKVERVGPHNCLIKVYAGSFPRNHSRERKFD